MATPVRNLLPLSMNSAASALAALRSTRLHAENHRPILATIDLH